MFELTVIGSIGVFICLLLRDFSPRVGLALALSLVTIFLALRYDFGPDYLVYYDAFNGDNPIWQTFEPGWVLLNSLFQWPGFFVFVSVVASLNGVVYYRHISRYSPEGLYWVSFLLYVFHPEMLLTQASAMRQALALLVFMLAMPLLETRRYLIFSLFAVIAASFHASALVLLVVPLFHRLAVTSRRIAIGIVATAYFGMLMSAPALRNQIGAFTESFGLKYAVYQDPGAVSSGLGVVLVTLMFIATLIGFSRSEGDVETTVFSVAALGFLAAPLTVVLDLASRVGMFFGPAIISVIPRLPFLVRGRLVPIIGTGLLASFALWRFFGFFNPETWSAYFIEYRTVLRSL